MAAKLQSPYPPTMPVSLPFARAAVPQISPQLADTSAPFRGAVHLSQNSTSSEHSNPFRRPRQPHQVSRLSSGMVFSPISPIEEDYDNKFRQPSTRPNVNTAHADMSDQRKSVNLRKLDGKPYLGHEDEAESKPRNVKVAQDMYAGDMPPGYDPKGYQGPLATNKKESHTGPCHKCGGHKKDPSEASTASVGSEKLQQPQNIDCNKCGGNRSMPPSSYPRDAMGNARAQPQGAPRAAPIQSSDAGPSSVTRSHQHKHSCGKCGRRRRPDSTSTSGLSSPQQAGLSFHSVPRLQTSGFQPIGINVEPPTAITERAPTLPFSPASTAGEGPLIQHNQPNGYKKERRPSRSGSISSLIRGFSFSRRRKSSNNPLPSQQLAHNGEQNPNTIINKISYAMRDGDANYARLGANEHMERPNTPFSFVDKPQEDQSFEMNDMRKSKQAERRNSWDKADEASLFLGNPNSDRPRYSRSQTTSTRLRPAEQTQDDVFLALPPDQRPGVARFKSLRSGVSRATNGLQRSASQISRSSSLRRLESVKKVPQFWYRDDMAIEGAHGEYNNYTY